MRLLVGVLVAFISAYAVHKNDAVFIFNESVWEIPAEMNVCFVCFGTFVGMLH